MVRGDSDETFFSHGFDEERSKVLYSSFKHPLPNIFQGTAFKKHAKMLIEDKSTTVSKLSFFSYCPLRTVRKKLIIFFGNVHLHPIDCSYEDFSNYSVKSHTFYPQHFHSRFPDERQLFHGKK